MDYRNGIFRMINDEEYYHMVGGTHDDVFDVVLEPPRAGESIVLRWTHWRELTSALLVADPTPRKKPMRGLIWNTEEMAGYCGNIIRYGSLREMAPIFAGLTTEHLRPALSRSAEVEEVLASYETLRAFMIAADSLTHSVHVMNEDSLRPERYPHRARQRLSRQLKKERKMNQQYPLKR